jgi:hypothetical protein
MQFLKVPVSALFVFMMMGSYAQVSKIKPENLDSLKNLELTMQGQAEMIIDGPDQETRKTSCYNLIKTLVLALKIESSYYYPFDSLKQISILKSPDDKFRIFTWNYRNDNDSYRFYGAIQRNEKTGNNIFPLFDAGPLIKRPEDTIVDNNFWWGALYYNIIPVKSGKETCYTLLGWNGANNKSNKKVIDVLRWQEGVPVFGAPIFKAGENDIMQRVVFEYNNSVNDMVLRFELEKNWIVFDHLIPITPKATGHYELYYPDGSYDYFVFEKGFWVLKEQLFDNGTIKTGNDDIEQRSKKVKTKEPPKKEEKN